MRTAERWTAGSREPRIPPGRDAPATARPTGLGHRPGLDGLRALAVLAVLAYHTGVLRSGWIGVDVFFALSGYLITGLLLGELDGTGTIALRRFWARRARRLIPGVVLLIGFVVLLGGLRLPGWEAPHLDDLVGAVTYSSNWLRVVAQRDYWSLFRTPGPLEHVWSLAVEEQFYLVWPVVIWFVGRRHRSWIAPVTAGAFVGTSFLQVWLGLHGASTERLYVGTDTRAPAFLLGALFVVCFDRAGRPARWAIYTVPVTLTWLLAAGVILDGSSKWTYRGALLVVSALGASTVLGAARLPGASPAARFLSWVPLQRLGRWSYGVYLFHWPIAVALRGQQMLGIQRFVLVTALSLGFAAASYELLEHRIRIAGVPRLWRVPAFAASAVILLAACGTTAPERGRDLDSATRAELLAPLAAPGGALAGSGSAAAAGASRRAGEPVPTSLAQPFGAEQSTTSAPPATSGASSSAPEAAERPDEHAPVDSAGTGVPATTSASPAEPPTAVAVDAALATPVGPVEASPDNALAAPADGARILVLGDSVPFQLAQKLTATAATRNITVAVRAAPGCTPSDDPADHYRDDTRDVCASVQQSLPSDLDTFAPLALVVYYGLAGPSVYSHGAPLDACSAPGREALADQLQRVVDLATTRHIAVVLVPPANPPSLAWIDVNAQAAGADCYRSVYAELATAHPATVRLLRIDQFVCPGDPTHCPDQVDGVQLRYDGIHFAEAGAAKVIPWILDRLVHP